MKKNNTLITCLLLIFLFGLPIHANMDKSLTIWGTKVKLTGFKSSSKRIKKYAIRYLRKNNLYVVTDSPTVQARLTKEDESISLKVKSILTGTQLYSKKFFIEGKGTKAVKNTVARLIDDFRKLLPYSGLVYSKRGTVLKINAGTTAGIRKGDQLETVRFRGEAPEHIDLDSSSFPTDVTGEVEVLAAKKHTSVVRVISESLVRKFDKVIFDREAGRFTSNPIKKGFKFYIGTTASTLSVENSKESTAVEKPDAGKKLKFSNPIPTIALSSWFNDHYGASVELQYRKVPLILGSGTELKATYMVIAPDFLYAFDKFNKGNVIAMSLGLHVYYNTVTEKLMYYISSKYIAPTIGFNWSKKSGAHTGTFKFRLFPIALLSEDQTKRGDSSTSSGMDVGLVYDYDITAKYGITSTLFYRRFKTDFEGSSSVGIDEEDTYIDSQYGVKLLLSIYFSSW